MIQLQLAESVIALPSLNSEFYVVWSDSEFFRNPGELWQLLNLSVAGQQSISARAGSNPVLEVVGNDQSFLPRWNESYTSTKTVPKVFESWAWGCWWSHVLIHLRFSSLVNKPQVSTLKLSITFGVQSGDHYWNQRSQRMEQNLPCRLYDCTPSVGRCDIPLFCIHQIPSNRIWKWKRNPKTKFIKK